MQKPVKKSHYPGLEDKQKINGYIVDLDRDVFNLQTYMVNFPKIYTQASAPTIPTDSIALWDDTSSGHRYWVWSKGGTQSVLDFAAASSGGITNHSLLSALDYASAGHTGFEPTVTKGNLFSTAPVVLTGSPGGALIGGGANISLNTDNISGTSPISINGDGKAVAGSVNVTVTTATLTVNAPIVLTGGAGALLATANISVTTANLTVTSPLTINSGVGALLSATTISIPQSSATSDGYLSSTDWSTFNGKVPYSGAVSSLVLGTYGLSANSISALSDMYVGGKLTVLGQIDPTAVLISATNPELRLTDGEYSRMNRVTASNELTLKNRISVPEATITPLAHWYMDDNAANTTVTDSSGNGYNGTWSRNTSSDSVAGKINTALNAGNANYASAGTGFGNFEYTNPFSVFTWFKGLSDTGAEQQLIGKYQHNYGETGVYGWRISLYSNYRITVILKDAFGYSEQIEATYQPGGFPFNVATNVGFTYNGSGSGSGLKMYVNGAMVSTGSGVLTHTIQNNWNVTLGAASDGGDKFSGWLDDERIYSSELTSSNAIAIYNSGTGTQAEIPGVPSTSEVTIIDSKDSAVSLEKGIHTFGTSSGNTIIDGRYIIFKVNNVEKAQLTTNGLLSANAVYASNLTANFITGLTANINGQVYGKGYFGNAVTKSANYTATTLDDTIVFSNAGTCLLPSATGSGKIYNIKNVSTVNVVLDGNSSDTIDGDLTQTLYSNEGLHIADYANNSWVVV